MEAELEATQGVTEHFAEGNEPIENFFWSLSGNRNPCGLRRSV